jgi:hypothetical protein
MQPLNKVAKAVNPMTGFFKREFFPEPSFLINLFEKCIPTNIVMEDANSIGYAIKTALILKGNTAICPMRVKNPTKIPVLKPKSRKAMITGI